MSLSQHFGGRVIKETILVLRLTEDSFSCTTWVPGCPDSAGAWSVWCRDGIASDKVDSLAASHTHRNIMQMEWTSMNEPIKHHFVPQFLLRQFAGPKEKLRIHRLADASSFTAIVEKTGHRNDGHTLYGAGYGIAGRDRTLLESAMSSLEYEAAEVIRELREDSAVDHVSEVQKEALCWFAGLQILRSRFTLGYILRQLELEGSKPESFSKEELQTSLLRSALVPYLDAWSRRSDAEVDVRDRWNPYAGMLNAFRWDIVRFQAPSLVISDAFVAQRGVRTEARGKFSEIEKNWANHGFVVPLSECESATMTLTPRIGLHLHRAGFKKRLKAEEFNRNAVYASRDFVAHAPGWEKSNPRLKKLMDKNLMLQRSLRRAMPANF